METTNQELSDELVKVRVEFKVSVGVRWRIEQQDQEENNAHIQRLTSKIEQLEKESARSFAV